MPCCPPTSSKQPLNFLSSAGDCAADTRLPLLTALEQSMPSGRDFPLTGLLQAAERQRVVSKVLEQKWFMNYLHCQERKEVSFTSSGI